MISLEEFKKQIRANEVDMLVDEVLLADEALHVSPDNVASIASALAKKYAVEERQVFVRVVGSAKLGFSTIEKRQKNGPILPRYRPFSANSDIDVVVICPQIFDLIWNDLSSYAHRSPSLPWNSGALGDYMVCGWLRPDHFPNNVRIRRCDDWWDVFHRLSADIKYGRRKVRGGLFHSFEHARRYQIRALAECVRTEGIEL